MSRATGSKAIVDQDGIEAVVLRGENMTDPEIEQYVENRNGELCQSEILELLDISKNPQIDHFEYENFRYAMWSKYGSSFTFTKRNWN